jgi:methionine aminotransferase
VQFAVAAPLQAALARFLGECPQHASELAQFYQHKRDRFCRLLAGTALRCVPSSGTYFQLADYATVSDLPDVEFARWLTREAGVATIPISVFSKTATAQRVVRFCFAKNDATLDAAAERLSRLAVPGGSIA